MRTEPRYRDIIGTFSEDLKPVTTRVTQIAGTLIPQPTYFYTEFVKEEEL